MSLLTACPNPACGTTYRVPEAAVSRKIVCKSCGQKFVVEKARQPTLDISVGETDANRPRAETGAEGSNSTAIPAQVGRFVVSSILGRGGFGIVYRATDPQLEREVAVKVPQQGLLESSNDRSRFLREAKAAAQLNHPYIVPVYDVGEEDGRPYIASAFVEGSPLAEQIDGYRDEFTRIAQLVSKLAGALEYAHRQGIVHRDVKPQNVIVDAVGNPRLLDFGLARIEGAAHKLTQEAVVMGTPAYMSPEQARGDSAAIGPATDQYSLGVLLYELLTGHTPFSGAPAVVIYNVLNLSPEAPRKDKPTIPRSLETICLKAMSKEPLGRYDSLADMAEDLDRWLGDLPIRARRAHLFERFVRWCRRNPVVASLVVLIFAVTAAGLAATSAALVRAEKALQIAATSAKEMELARQDAERSKREAVDALQRSLIQEGVAKQERETSRRQTALAEKRLAEVLLAQQESTAARKESVEARTALTTSRKDVDQQARYELYWSTMIEAYGALGGVPPISPEQATRAKAILEKVSPEPAFGTCWEWYSLKEKLNTLKRPGIRIPLGAAGSQYAIAVSDLEKTAIIAVASASKLRVVSVQLDADRKQSELSLDFPPNVPLVGTPVISRAGAYLVCAFRVPDPGNANVPGGPTTLRSQQTTYYVAELSGKRRVARLGSFGPVDQPGRFDWDKFTSSLLRNFINDASGTFFGRVRPDAPWDIQRPFEGDAGTSRSQERSPPTTNTTGGRGFDAVSVDGLLRTVAGHSYGSDIAIRRTTSATKGPQPSGDIVLLGCGNPDYVEIFPDKSRVVTCDSGFQLWRTDRLAPPIDIPGWVEEMDISADGRFIVTVSGHGVEILDGRAVP